MMRTAMVPDGEEQQSQEVPTVPAVPIERPEQVPAAPVKADADEALRALFIGGTPQDKLVVVENAIFAIMFGGQSYQIGGRKFTAADLKELMAFRSSLKSEIAASMGGSVTVGICRGL